MAKKLILPLLSLNWTSKLWLALSWDDENKTSSSIEKTKASFCFLSTFLSWALFKTVTLRNRLTWLGEMTPFVRATLTVTKFSEKNQRRWTIEHVKSLPSLAISVFMTCRRMEKLLESEWEENSTVQVLWPSLGQRECSRPLQEPPDLSSKSPSGQFLPQRIAQESMG